MDIDNSVVSDLFEKVATDAKVVERRYRIRENGLPHTNHAFCSLLVFTYPNDPTFLNYEQDPFPLELVEKKVGYVLMIEIGDYVVLLRRILIT